MGIKIKAVSHYLPENIITNDDIINKYELRTSSKIVEKVIGIKQRRWASEDQATSDLAYLACKDIDLTQFDGPIFLSTITGDYLTPSTSSVIKSKLKIKGHAPTFDINAACAGKIFALDTAINYLKGSKYNQALVIASECRSRFTNKKDRKTTFLFADAASAILLEKDNSNDDSIEWIHTKTEASDHFEILIPAGGTKAPINHELIDQNQHLIKINDGTKIGEITTTRLIDTINQALEENNQKLDDFDQFIFHQGNGNLIKTIANKLNIDLDKVTINFPEYGNSSSASIGVSLSEHVNSSSIKDGERILLMAMGAGYHIGMASVIWKGKK